MTARAQKPDFVFRRNGRVHLNRRGASVQSTTGSRGVRISGSNAEYTMFRGSVKSTGYPLHSPVSPSLPLPCATVYHHVSTGLYFKLSTTTAFRLLSNLLFARCPVILQYITKYWRRHSMNNQIRYSFMIFIHVFVCVCVCVCVYTHTHTHWVVTVWHCLSPA